MTLLDKTSDIYKRRLVKEITAHGMALKAIYYHGERIIGARFSDGQLRVKLNKPAAWCIVSDESLDSFTDDNGKAVCASRAIR